MNYPISVIEEARRLGCGGWTAYAIHHYWSRNGMSPVPSRQTIAIWLDDAAAARKAADNRRRAEVRGAAAAKYVLKGKGPHYEAGLIRRLDQAGVPAASIAKALTVLLPRTEKPLSEFQVRQVLKSAVCNEVCDTSATANERHAA